MFFAKKSKQLLIPSAAVIYTESLRRLSSVDIYVVRVLRNREVELCQSKFSLLK